MPSISIPFGDTGQFQEIVLDYLREKPELRPFYGNSPTMENFEKQIAQKKFSKEARRCLSHALRRQYAHLSPSLDTMANITALENDKTFTVTTGHQLNLFTGPLYFLLKIADAILLSRKLSHKYPNNHFVPVYWMATEDHDFDEINHFWFKDKKIIWKRDSGGPVGRFSTKGLQEVLADFSQKLGPGENADELRSMFDAAYLQHDNLADATRFLANELFGNEGLVIVDGDDPELKKLFSPIVKREFTQGFSFDAVTATTTKLPYSAQVHPREINLFYMKDGLRARLVEQDGQYGVLDFPIKFSTNEILSELDNHPERFSPNVILRPLYQEAILPNLCYIGGGGEIAYWLQLKSMFESADVPFPILMLRDSVLIASEKHEKQRIKLGLEWADLFLPDDKLSARIAQIHSPLPLDFSPQRSALEKQFLDLLQIAKKTHPSFLGSVKAQQVRQLKGLDNLEKRLLRAEKKRLEDLVDRALELRSQLFPGGSLQERKANFSEFYLALGESVIPLLMKELDPLNPGFRIVVSA